MSTRRQHLQFRQGETFFRVMRWEQLPLVYKAITGITQGAPAEVTSPSHELVNGWRAAIASVRGMVEINTVNDPLRESDLHSVTVVNGNTVRFNDINSSDFHAYESGGYLQYYTPVDLTGYTARMEIKDRVGGMLLTTLTTENGRIAIDATAKTTTLRVEADDVAAFLWLRGVYDLEMVSPTGIVTTPFAGTVGVSREVTT